MMTPLSIAAKSIVHFWRTNLAVAAGVAAATAVLCGALIVGDSLRQSLRNLTLQRLGKIDQMLVSEGFFSVKLAEHIRQLDAFQQFYDQVEPAILFPSGSVETTRTPSPRRANEVTILGITDRFWEFESGALFSLEPLQPDSVIINQALANQLGIRAEDIDSDNARLTVRIPKQHQLPADSPLSKQDDLIESLVSLRIQHVIPTTGLGRFGLHPTQADPFNVYLPIELLQESLEPTVLRYKSEPEQANVLFLAGPAGTIAGSEAAEKLVRQLRPQLEDVGINLRRITRTFPSPENGVEDKVVDDKNLESKVSTSPSSDDRRTVFDYWSLSTDRLVFNDAAAAAISIALPKAKPVFTYLANDIRISKRDNQVFDSDAGIPFSMLTAIDFDEHFQPASLDSAIDLQSLQDDELVLVEWAANDLGAKVGDWIEVTYFEPETTHGSQIERRVELKLVGIAKLAEPDEGYVVPRRGPIQPSVFSVRPEITNDPDLTPEVPGITDAESIERWDLPFETASRIRPQDDLYWQNHRTTPKGFVSLATGQRLWNSRFGQVTNFRLPVESFSDKQSVEQKLLPTIGESIADFGIQILPLKERGLLASSGSTPFDVLFLALSMFVIGSALILVAILFRLGFQQRAAEVGLLSAVGFSPAQLRSLWLLEMSIVAMVGGMLGVLAGVAYGALLIQGLSTWWVGAISRPFLQLHLNPLTLVVGLFSGWLVCFATIAWSMRKVTKLNPRNLLAGQIEISGEEASATHLPAAKPDGRQKKKNLSPGNVRRSQWITVLLLLVSLGLTGLAVPWSGEAQAGAFMGAGFLALVAGLLVAHRFFSHSPAVGTTSSDRTSERSTNPQLSLASLALLNARRNPLRSTLTIGLVAVASFLIAAVSAFRLAPTEEGTGGFDYIAKSSQPIRMDLSTPEGLRDILGSDAFKEDQRPVVMPFRYRAGEDASCNNLYQSTQPQILGLPEIFIDHFSPSSAGQPVPGFAWAASIASKPEERANPWTLLSASRVHQGTRDDPIPVVIDKNTANYSLKIYATNSIFEMPDDRGRSLSFRVVGFLENTLLQGSLMIGEADFLNAFPEIGGYQFFLIQSAFAPHEPEQTIAGGFESRLNDRTIPPLIDRLNDRLGDYGFMAQPSAQVLEGFMRVQNTYLSTFQALGALGLLLGTLGLAAVQIRSVLERRKELGLLRAVGFSEARLRQMVMLENGALLGTGLLVGILAALFTTLPHGIWGRASVPWMELAIMFATILAVGLLASLLASRQVSKLPLLAALRD